MLSILKSGPLAKNKCYDMLWVMWGLFGEQRRNFIWKENRQLQSISENQLQPLKSVPPKVSI